MTKTDEEFEFEATVEINIYNNIIQKMFVKDSQFLKRFRLNWKDPRFVPSNISWINMKEDFDWGFLKGSKLSEIVNWIYLRPDIAFAVLDSGNLTVETLFKNGLLNQHYFLVKKNAVAYLLMHCEKVVSPTKDTNYEEEESREEVEREEKRRKKRNRFFHDEAIETNN